MAVDNFNPDFDPNGNDDTSGKRLVGSELEDTLDGGLGGDLISGNGGNDTINGKAGDDRLLGGAGNDQLDGSFGDDALYGDSGDDTLIDTPSSGDGSNLLDGGDGNDKLTARSFGGNQTLKGGAGQDTLNATGKNLTLDGGTDNDRLSITGRLQVNGEYKTVKNGSATLDGGGGDDRLYASTYSKANLNGGDGADYLSTSGVTNQTLDGGAGNDTLSVYLDPYYKYQRDNNTRTEQNVALNGGDGNDTLTVRADEYDQKTSQGQIKITANGGNGDDVIDIAYPRYGHYNNSGFTKLDVDAGAGNDSIKISHSLSTKITTGAGSDTVYLTSDQYKTILAGTRRYLIENPTGNLRWGIDEPTSDNPSDYVNVEADPILITDFTTGKNGDVLDYSDLLDNSALNYQGTNPFSTGYLTLTQSGSDTLVGFDKDGSNGSGENSVNIGILQNVVATQLSKDNFNADFDPNGNDDTSGKRLVGSELADTLIGGLGVDAINGNGGNDSIEGKAGNDILSGGAGNDQLDGSFGDDALYGDSGDDTLIDTPSSGDGSNLLDGGDGNDKLTARSFGGNQTLKGGAGQDTLNATGKNLTLDGGTDNDRLSITGRLQVNGEYKTVKNGSATLDGGGGDDRLYASTYSKANLNGGDGADYLSTSGVTNQTLDGGAGNDTLSVYLDPYYKYQRDNNTRTEQNVALNGGDGNDTLTVRADEYDQKTSQGQIKITANGGNGDDVIDIAYPRYGHYNNSGFTKLDVDAGAGNDSIKISHSLSTKITTGAGSDTVYLTSDQYKTILAGTRRYLIENPTGNLRWGIDEPTSDNPSDYVNVEADPILITDFTTGKNGDVLDYSDLLDNSALNYQGTNPFSTGYLTLTQSGSDTLVGFDKDGSNGSGENSVNIGILQNVVATQLSKDNFNADFDPNGNDDTSGKRLVGSELADTLIGGLGVDAINGNGGNDSIEGKAGNDILSGGAGNDQLDGSFGDDALYGDSGDDTLIDTPSSGDGSNLLDGGDGNDKLTARSFGGNQTLKGGAGQDTLNATGKNLTLDGGTDNDRLSITGRLQVNGEYKTVKNGSATLDGGGGDDRLYASTYSKANLNGGDGADYLSTSGVTNQTLDGGAGNDTLSVYLDPYYKYQRDNNTRTEQNVALNGGDGNDTLTVRADEYDQKTSQGQIKITANGGNGDDVIDIAYPRYGHYNNSGFTKLDVDAGAGNDSIKISHSLSTKITTGAGSDTVYLTSDQYKTILAGTRRYLIENPTGNLRWGIDEPTSDNPSDYVNVEADPILITDFTTGKNGDVLDYSDLLDNSALNYQGTNPFANGYVNLLQSGNDTLFQFDADGSNNSKNQLVTMAVLQNVDVDDFLGKKNNAPEVTGPVDLGAIDEDKSIRITEEQLLQNSSDVDGDELSVVGLKLSEGEGELESNSDGSWTYTPTKDWNGSVSFSYSVSDGNDDDIKIPQEYSEFNDSYYTIVEGPTWNDAEANAQKLGGHLVTINDSKENDFVFKTFEDTDQEYWIGYNDQEVEGEWKWSSGDQSDFESWWAMGPENPYSTSNEARDFAAIYTNHPTPGTDGLWGYDFNHHEKRGIAEIKVNTNSSVQTSASLIVNPVDDDPVIIGTRGNDLLIGKETNDFIYGRRGNDELLGKEGNDDLFGEEGDDRAYGGYQNDNIDGGSGNDRLYGEQGDDLLEGGIGNDDLYGGDDDDILYGGDGNDRLTGGEGADYLDGGNGSDIYVVDDERDTIIDSGTDLSFDTIIYRYAAAAYQLTSGIEKAVLQTGDFNTNVQLSGNDQSNDITTGDSNDIVNAGAGDDIIYTASGNDKVEAGAGNDLIIGGDGAGDDNYDGGSDIDTIKYTSATDDITVDLSKGTATSTHGGDKAGIGNDKLSKIENVIGGNFDDQLIGDNADNTFTGEKGNDVIDGGDGVDTAIFSGMFGEYKLSNHENPDWLYIQDQRSGRDGKDQIKEIESFDFQDKTFTYSGSWENTFSSDINSDGLISGGKSYQLASDQGAVVLSTSKGTTYNDASTSKWDAQAATQTETGFQVLLDGDTVHEGKKYTWTTDSTGTITKGSGWITDAQAVNNGWENSFESDINSDGLISGGKSYQLASDQGAVVLSTSKGTTYNDASTSKWDAQAATQTETGFQVLLDGDTVHEGKKYTWTTDSTGTITKGSGWITDAQAVNNGWENSFESDINSDGLISGGKSYQLASDQGAVVLSTSKGTTYNDASTSKWDAQAATQTETGFQVLLDGDTVHEGKKYTWTTDSTGTITKGSGWITDAQAVNNGWENTFESDINSDGLISGGKSYQLASDQGAVVLSTSKGTTYNDASTSKWDAQAATQTETGFQVLLDGDTVHEGKKYTWTTDSTGTITKGSGWITDAQAVNNGWENTFESDINSDGLISGGKSYQLASDQGAVVLSTSKGTTYNDASTSKWDAQAATQTETGFQVLLDGDTVHEGKKYTWTTDSTGTITKGSGWITDAQAVNNGWENTFESDINSDGLISGGISYQLASDQGAVVLSTSKGTTYNDASTSKWDAQAATQTETGFQVLLDGDAANEGKQYVWDVNASGTIIGGSGWKSTDQAISNGWEELFGVDINNNGSIDFRV